MRSWHALARDPSLLRHAIRAIVAPRAFAPFSRIFVISPLDRVRRDPETDGHVIMPIRQLIFDQHELFQKIETNDPAVDLKVAAINAGRDNGEIDD